MALGAVARAHQRDACLGGAHRSVAAARHQPVNNTRRACVVRPISTRASCSWQTAASALPSPHSAALEPSAQSRGRQLQEKSGAGARASQSSAAAAAAGAVSAVTPASPAATAHRPRCLQTPPPPPRPTRLSSPHSPRQHLPEWLGSAVRRAVLSLDEAPLLVVKVGDEGSARDAPCSSAATSTSFVTHAIPRAALSAPALWPAIAATVVAPAGKEPGALLLFHKIEEEKDDEVSSRSPPSSAFSSHHHLRLSDFAALERSGIATAELAGRVGDCCHGEAEAGGGAGGERGDESRFVDSDLRAIISPRHSSSPSLHSETHWSSSSSDASDVAFYGVVVQTTRKWRERQRAAAASSFSSDIGSDDASTAAGCFVLKTVRTRSSSAPGGCSCVYYSLTRVGRAGEPLAEQLKKSWLS